MAITATITVSVSTNPATAHLGRFFADLRVGGKQATTTGTVEYIRNWIVARNKEAAKRGVKLTVTDETYLSEFTKAGGLRGIVLSD